MLLPTLLEDARGAGAAAARVTGCRGGLVSASGEAEFYDLPLFAPYGVCAVPEEGGTALVLPLDGAGACAGVLCPPPDGLEPGELRLCSAGGARIVLKNNGEILLNGLAVRPDGTLAEGGGGR